MSVAVADVVRTSLGPRGMDKMVSLESSVVKPSNMAPKLLNSPIQTNMNHRMSNFLSLVIDPNTKG